MDALAFQEAETTLKCLITREKAPEGLSMLDKLEELDAPCSLHASLEELMEKLEEPYGPDDPQGRWFAMRFAAAERILFAAHTWNDGSFASTWQQHMERALAARFPILFETATVAIYGVGNVAACLLSIIERYCADKQAELVFVHSTKPTGSCFRTRPLVNIRDLGAVNPDVLVIASLNYRDSIMQSIADAGTVTAPIHHIPDEAQLLLTNFLELVERISDPPVAKPVEGHRDDRMEPFYVRGTKWQCLDIIRSFPGLARRIRGVIDPVCTDELFCGIPVMQSPPPGDFSWEEGSSDAPVLSISEALLSYLSRWEEVEYRPVAIRLEASTICQLNCAGCYMRLENNGTVGLGYLKAADLRKLLDENPSIYKVELSNNGEPFCNPEMLEILEALHERGAMGFFLNGVNLNYAPDEVLEALVRCGVRSMNISIDGVTQEVYETYRRKGNIENVYANIQRINYYKKKYDSQYPTLLWQYILMEHNQFEAADAVEKAHELEMDIYFKPDWRGGFTPKNPKELSKVTNLPIVDWKTIAAKRHREYDSDIMCSQMVLSPQVNWDGRLLGCCTTFKSDWGINVFEQPLGELFNNSNYRAAVLSLLSGHDSLNHDGPCRNCYIFRENVLNYEYKLPLIWSKH